MFQLNHKAIGTQVRNINIIMTCRSCQVNKLRQDFPEFSFSATAAPDHGIDELPNNQLTFICLKCLAEKSFLHDALAANTITEEAFEQLSAEVQDWKTSRYPTLFRLNRCTPSPDQNIQSITVTLLTNTYIMPVDFNSTTVGQVKVFLGKKHGRMPQTYRLLFNGKELKSRNGFRGEPILLRDAGVQVGCRIDAIIALSAFSGKSVIEGASLDRHGNASGDFDLIIDGSCVGLSVVVLQMYTGEGFDFSKPRAALQEMGFTLHLYQNNVPNMLDLKKVLEDATQLWVISTNHRAIPPEYINVIHEFNKTGKSLYIWGDNDPYNAVANDVLNKVLPGVILHSSYQGCQNVQFRSTVTSGAGFGEHYIFTGVANLYEGATIARFQGSNSKISYIMNSSEGAPALGVCEHDGVAGRIAVDCGFTRLFCNWDDAGTKRFVKNICGWLCGFDLDI